MYPHVTSTLVLYTVIISLVSDICLSHEKRESRFSTFYEWLKSNGVDTSNVEMGNFEDLGYGLKATKDLKVCFDL